MYGRKPAIIRAPFGARSNIWNATGSATSASPSTPRAPIPDGSPATLLQRSQTSAGITPARISTANALQPRHRPNTDSSVAATISSPSNAYAAVLRPNPSANTAADTENAAPIPWAKRLGGAATRSAPRERQRPDVRWCRHFVARARPHVPHAGVGHGVRCTMLIKHIEIMLFAHHPTA